MKVTVASSLMEDQYNIPSVYKHNFVSIFKSYIKQARKCHPVAYILIYYNRDRFRPKAREVCYTFILCSIILLGPILWQYIIDGIK